MKKYRAVLKADFNNIKRDPILLLLLFVPFIMLLLSRYGLPELAKYWADVSNYFELIIIFFALMNAMFPAFILAFIILDEKDLSLIPILRTNPVGIEGLLKVRVLSIIILGFMGSFLLMNSNGLIKYNLTQNIIFSLLSALSAPMVTLLIATIAKNKVEGLSLLKVANLTLLIPFAAAFMNSPLEFVLSIFPAFWVIHLIDPIFNFYWSALAGCGVILLMNYYAFRFAVKRL